MAATGWADPPLRVRWTQALVAWWYGAPMLRRYRPLVRAEFAAGDQIDEARFLARAGYHHAAVCLCRAAIEARVRRAAMVSPVWDRVRSEKRPTDLGHLLWRHGFWSKNDKRHFHKLYEKLSQHSHGVPADGARCWELIDRSANLMERLDALVLRCLRTGGESDNPPGREEPLAEVED
ncbi:hypothetical protein [Botrimarina sp.]|uniref:hypothetical protein n=1 Tax=Botrimarina sp. TaxID=2795802 RepID=UPI0032EDF78D